MFEVNIGSVGSVNVVSSDNGGLSNDQIADMAADKIMYISDEAPEVIFSYTNIRCSAILPPIATAISEYIFSLVTES